MKIYKAILCIGAVTAMVACGGGDTTTTDPMPEKKAEKTEEKKEEAAPANPMMSLNVGDWASYTSTAGGMTTEMKNTVTAKDDMSITYDVATTMMGTTTTTSVNVPFVAPVATDVPAAVDMPTPVTTDEDVTIGDKTVKCKKMTMDTAGMVTESWTSMDVPFMTVRTITKDAAGAEVSKMELTGWGSAQ